MNQPPKDLDESKGLKHQGKHWDDLAQERYEEKLAEHKEKLAAFKRAQALDEAAEAYRQGKLDEYLEALNSKNSPNSTDETPEAEEAPPAVHD